MRTRKSLLHLALVAGVVFQAGTATAQSATNQTAATGPAETFGGKGQVAISSDAVLSAQRATMSGVSGGTTAIRVAPALDYFAMESFSIGGFAGLDYTTSGDNHSTRFSVGPRVGYNVILSDLVSLWPKSGLSIASTSTTASQTNGTVTQSTTNSDTNLALNLFVPIMFHPANHFFAGFGPFIDTDLSGDARTTVWGGKLTIGGWL